MITDYKYRLHTADGKCKRCDLSTGCSIFGHSYLPFSNIELIVVSAYPAAEEIKQGITLASNQPKDKMDLMNTGRFFRSFITYVFDQDPTFPSELKPFYERIFFTNMIKCSPMVRKEQREVKSQHINICKDWLELEIEEIEGYNFTVPILLAGTEASKLLHKDMTVYANRRKVHHYKERHACVISLNPAEVLRYSLKTIKESKVLQDGRLRVQDVAYWKPIPFGESRWHFKRDLELIKEQVVLNYQLRNK